MKEKQGTTGERIERIRGERSQAEFGELLGGASQSAVSAWERDDKDRSPSAAIYFRLAALAYDPDDSIFFLEQAGLEPDAVVSVADTLLRKGDVKMDSILATAESKLKERMGDRKQMEDEGMVVLVPPFTAGRWAGQKGLPSESVEAWRVSNKASTYYIVPNAATVYQALGAAIAPGDTIVFDASETDFRRLIGEEVLTEAGNILSIGRLVYTAEHPQSRLVLAPASDAPDKWIPIYLESPHHPMQELNGQILGRLVARFPARPNEYWKRRAGEHATKIPRGRITRTG